MGKVHLVIDLDSIQDDDSASVGSKALSLIKLSRFGFNVPTGFCVTSIAYREHLNTNGIIHQLNADLARLKDAKLAEKNQILSDNRQAIVQAPLSETLAEQIYTHYHKLAADYVAVRSSATAEDLPGHSFAGQYDTFLGISDLEGCLQAVKKCWASLWTLRAYEYRQKNGFDHLKVNMAVIIQSFIAADASGIVFTADPVTGRTDRMIVESCFGLGDALVSGKITPDRFAVAKDNLKIITKMISEKKFESVLDDHGAVHQKSIKGEMALAPSINETVVQKIAELAKTIEAKLGCPQDIEWAIRGTDVYLLQSRPITTLCTASSSRDHWVWSSFPAKEVMPDVVTPITKSLIDNLAVDMFDPVFNIFCLDRAGVPLHGYCAGRVYFNASFWAAVGRAIPGQKRDDFVRLAGSNPDLVKILEIFKNLTDNDLPKIKFSRVRFILKLPIVIAGILSCTPKRGRIILAETRAKYKKWEQLDVRNMSAEQIADCCIEITASFCDVLGYASYMFGTMIAYFGLESVCERWFSDITYTGRLLAGVGDLVDAQAAIDLWQLAVEANNLPELRKVLLEEKSWQNIVTKTSTISGANKFFQSWNEFMTRHGHHCRAEIELYNSRWAESPDYVLGLIRGYLSCIEKTNPLKNYEEIARQRRLFEQQCCRQLKCLVKRWIFKHLLIRSQNSAFFRENIKSEIVKLLATMRKLLVELGRRLHTDGILSDANDIFFLKLKEIKPVVQGQAGFDVQKIIVTRQAEYDRWLSIIPPDVIIGRFNPDEHVPEQIETEVDVLKGLAVSPGIATGKAKVVLRTDSDIQLEAGEILVAPFTDPGWVPYFLPASALVMDQGSILSHGSIVAREFGIPAVVNVGHATKIIKTGQTIQVDGNRGIVKIIQ